MDAQEARRLLDRLYGYEVSPVLWKKVLPRLSAGRVQSVATRIVVERERARMAFTSADYWSLEAVLRVLGDQEPGEPPSFSAALTAVDGSKVATGRDFTSKGQLRNPDVIRLDEEAARGLARGLDGAEVEVRHRRGQAIPPPARPPVHDLHVPAGSRAQASPVVGHVDAGRSISLREGLHHLHAHRQHNPVGLSPDRGP